VRGARRRRIFHLQSNSVLVLRALDHAKFGYCGHHLNYSLIFVDSPISMVSLLICALPILRLTLQNSAVQSINLRVEPLYNAADGVEDSERYLLSVSYEDYPCWQVRSESLFFF
jgi:hypothetical protein